MIASWVFNAAMAVVGAVGVSVLMQSVRDPARPTLWPRVVMVVALFGGLMAVLGVGLARALEGNGFGILRLWCWGLFVQTPFFAVVAASVLWREARRWSFAGIAVAVALVAIGVDAFLVEPTWLEVTHYRLTSDKLTEPLTIVVIADFQTDQIGDYERRVLAEVKKQQPDVILWAGDYLQEHRAERWELLRDELPAALAEADLQPRLGSYAVGGNVDNGLWPEIFASSQVEVFPETRCVERGEIAVTGLAMRESFATDVVVAPRDRFHIALGHCPNFALGEIEADLLVAGHIHGGQVRLPGIGPLMTLAQVPRSWSSGLTPLGEGRNLVVSRGVGMERSNAPRLRFLCRPELMVLHVAPAAPLTE